MKSKKRMNRQTAIDVLWMTIIMLLIIAGGRWQRGYWAVGPELAALLPGIVIILLRRKDFR